MTSLLVVEDLHRSFGRGQRTVRANDGISMSVEAGEVVGILGHNGAGKTTLVNQIVGLLRPDSGRIEIDGADAVADPARARRLTTVQAQANVPITGLTPLRAVELVGRIRGGPAHRVRRRAGDLIAALDLGAWANTPAQKVSGGVARLTAFAMCAVAPGRLVILDEPTNDVDPVRRRLLWHQIRLLADGGAAVLLVTHNVREAERAVDRLVVLDHGRVIASGTPSALVSRVADGATELVMEVDLVPGREPAWPDGVGPERHDALHASFTVAAHRAAEVVAWAEAARGAGDLERYELAPMSLEDAYASLTAAQPGGADAGAARAATTAGNRSAA